MKCLHCQKEFKEVRETAKFCSANCRVKYHREHGSKNEIKPYKVQLLLNEFKGAMDEFKGLIKSGGMQIQDLNHPTQQIKPITDHLPQSNVVFSVEPKKPVKQPKSVVRYISERLECETPEDYEQWLANLESDPYLSTRDKAQAKTGRLD